MPCLSKRAQDGKGGSISRMKKGGCVESDVGSIRVSRGWSGKDEASGPLHPSFVIGDQSDKADKTRQDEKRKTMELRNRRGRNL